MLSPTLPRAAYVDQAVFRREQQRIFSRQWVAAGREADAARPGSFLVVDIAGESVLVVRGEDGLLRGFLNVCRHRGAELVTRAPDQTESRLGCFSGAIRCPYHAWTYALDGALRRAPFLAELPPGDLTLRGVAVDTWGGFVWVHVDPPAVALGAQLGAVAERVRRYPLAQLGRGATLRYDVAANWKVLAENYNECYHCGPVHPELCDLVPSFRRGGNELEWEAGVAHREGAWTFTTTGTSSRRPFPGLDDAERVRHKGELVYPNLWLSLSAEHVAAFTLWPLAVDRTVVVCDVLFHPDALGDPGFDPSDALGLWDVVNRQDWAICESVQRGMASRAFERGWFAPAEDDSADLGRWYEAAMGDGGVADGG